MPISEKDLARYITFLTSSFKSATSVLNYVNGVRFYHVSNHLAFTHLSSHNISLLLKGVTKRLSSKPHQKLPITPAILHAIHNALDFTNCTHISFWAACLTGFFGFLRKSNLVPPSVPTFDPARHISRSSFTFLSDGSVLLTLHWSKTIQHNQRLLQLPYHPIPGSPLCPVKAVTRMIHTIPAPPSSPAFLVAAPRGLVTLTHTSFVAMLRYFLRQAGFPPATYSGHSFRRGGCTFASQSGIPPDLLQTFGDWRSDSYQRYLATPLQRRVTVSRAMSSHIANSLTINV